MILECPSCKTGFNIPDSALGADGRKVRCASCKHVWHATHADAVHKKPKPKVATRAVPKRPAQPDRAAAFENDVADTYSQMADEAPGDPEMAAAAAALRESLAEPESSLDDDFEQDERVDIAAFDNGPADYSDEADVATDSYDSEIEDDDEEDFLVDMDDEEEDDVFAVHEADVRDRIQARRRGGAQRSQRMRKVILAGWAALAFLWIGLPAVFVTFPEKIVALWPASSVIYKGLGELSDVERLRAAGGALSPAITDAPEIVRALLHPTTVEERDGVTALILRGFVENAGRRSARVPKLRAAILDARGNVLDSWMFDPPGLIITRGQKLNFEQVRSPIPPGANQAIIETVKGAFSQTEASQEH